MDIRTFLTITHIIGTAFGVGAAALIEVFIIKALVDGKIDPTEHWFLRATSVVLRIGLIILILSGFGFVLVMRLNGQTEHLLDAKLWTKLVLTIILFFNAVGFQTKAIPLALGSAISIVSWLTALIVGVFRASEFSLITTIPLYFIAIIVTAVSIQSIHQSLSKSS